MVEQSPDAVLDRLLSAIAKRDLSTSVDCFASEEIPPVMLGSEAGEQARGRKGLEEFFERVYRKQGAYKFKFPSRNLVVRDNLAWMIAEGGVIDPDDAEEKPYRLVAVFIKADDKWRLALWSGSEPVQH